MTKDDLIRQLNELYLHDSDGCNQILETVSKEYEQKALVSRNFHQTIKESPLYWETEIEWYKSKTTAPLQLWGFRYAEDEKTLIALADNYLTGPPDMHMVYIQELPTSILIAALHKLENININNHMSQKNHYTGLTDAEVLESRRKNGVNILTPPKKIRCGNAFLKSSETH